ncbi:MAG: hypothetical protein CL947_02230 [Epsilonproteobacteria bacterium]|nr:hypothetical protein [Campylobacterota bacterium]|tara:strand:- start:95 stop:565 length:471 start_codon:yes stop_codon:yes gene_type:complete
MISIIDIAKEIIQSGLQFIAITGIQFIIFLLFAKYKTGQSFSQLWKSYLQLFVRALLFTVTLLGLIIILTKYSTICSVAVVLLAISSFSIMLKYVDLAKEEKGVVFDLGILLSNAYVMYSLATQDPISITHYLVLYAIVLYVFLYQRLKVAYQEWN